MEVGVKIYPGPKRLYDGNNPRRKLSSCSGLEVFQKCFFPAETETTEKRTVVLEVYPQHLWDSEYHLAVGNIQHKTIFYHDKCKKTKYEYKSWIFHVTPNGTKGYAFEITVFVVERIMKRLSPDFLYEITSFCRNTVLI